MDFVIVKPRERAGSSTSGKFDYQKDLAICMLLEYHEKQNDYLFVFDYHDDLVVLNSEISPTSYSFFQIKSKEGGTWTLKSILKRKQGKEGNSLNSILGKLFDHTIKFSSKITSLNFISNTSFSIRAVPKGKKIVQDVCLENLSKVETDLISKSIAAEFSIDPQIKDFLRITYFKVHQLSTKESGTHAKGRISEFLDKRAAGKKYNIESVYKSIYDEVKIKNNYKEEINSFEELKDRKSIGRSYFDDLLKLIGERKDYDKIWTEVNAFLINSNVAFGDIRNYKTLWKQIEIERMNPINKVLHNHIREINRIIKNLEVIKGFKEKNILESMRLVSQQLKFEKSPFPASYIETLIFAELYD